MNAPEEGPLRLECLRLACATASPDMPVKNIIDRANGYRDYIVGSVSSLVQVNGSGILK